MPPEPFVKLIVGLGNPGPEYESTRHNIGFMVVDSLRGAMVRSDGEERHFADSHIWQARYASRNVFLQEPLTYMNLSGNAVAKLCREQQLLPAEILVISDDVALPFGKIRIRKKGGDGGHNGLKNIIDRLETQAFNRMRIGLGRDSETNSEMTDFVLGPFNVAEQEQLPLVIEAAAKAVQTALRRGITTAMNEYNGLDILDDQEEQEAKTEESER